MMLCLSFCVGVLQGDKMAAEMKARWEEYRKAGRESEVEKELEKLRRRMGDVSKKFANAEFAKHRYAFGAKRKTGARGIGICKN